MRWEDYGDSYEQQGEQRGDDQILLEFVRIARETDKGWLVVFKDGKYVKRQAWLPKSKCKRGEEGTLAVPRWLVEEEDLKSYVVWDGP